jgi:DnaK suppressor protein
MAEKKTRSQKAKNISKKPVKASARRTPAKPKPKTVRPKKGVSGKPVSQKSVPKKTAAQKNVKPVAQRKTASPPQQAARKPSVIKKPKTSPKRSVSVNLAPRKPKMTSEEERRLFLRRALIHKREEIVREVKNEISKYIKGETRQLVDTALDDGDWSVVDLSEDISFKHMSTHRENLLKIDEALRKLSEGTYGICEDCGEAISEQRLKILPFAIFCTDCQERRELIEAIERREGLIG